MKHATVVEPVGQADLVVVPRGPRPSPRAWTALVSGLPPAEQLRLGDVYRHAGQHESAVGWNLLMGLAARHHVQVRRNPVGRPVADAPLDVSLSHGGGWVAVAGYRQGRVGVDVERVREIGPALARRCLSVPELGWLERAADAATRRDRFLRLWTAKEAYLKATGTGLAVDPRTFTIDATTPVPHLVGEEQGRWHFRSSAPAEHVCLTVCLERVP